MLLYSMRTAKNPSHALLRLSLDVNKRRPTNILFCTIFMDRSRLTQVAFYLKISHSNGPNVTVKSNK